MQLFLIGYIIVSICEIFTIGGFPLNGTVRVVFSAVHIAAIVATLWILMINGIVGYQLLDDGTAVSLGLILLSAAIVFIGTGYIALDTGLSWTGFWDSTLEGSNRSYALYTIYQLFPLVCLVVFFLLESYLVLRVLGERKPMSEYIRHTVSSLLLTSFQCILLQRPCSLPLAKFSNMSSVSTYVMAPMERLMVAYLSHSSLCLP